MAYRAAVLFPVVALIISTVLEDYVWTPTALAGVALILAGNILAMRQGAEEKAGM